MLRIYFTNHARTRLMERHGVLLSMEEERVIADALSNELGGSSDGKYRMNVVLPGRVKFQAVVSLPEGAIVTTLHPNSTRINPKRLSRARGRDYLDRSLARDLRHMHARHRGAE